MLCKNCGNNVKSDFKYCPYCGERFLGDFQDHYGELTPPYVIDEQPDENADVYVSESEEVEPDFVLPPPDPPIELEEPYFVYYPDAPSGSEAPSAWSSVPESEQSIQSPEVLPNSISGWKMPSSPPPARAQQPGTVAGWEAPPSPPPVREQQPDTASGWEAPSSPPPVRAQQPGTAPGWEVPPSPPPVRAQHPVTAPGWEVSPSPPPAREQHPVTAPGWEAPPSPPPVREQQPGTVPGWEAPPSPPPARAQHPGTVPGWEAPPSPPPGWEQQPGTVPGWEAPPSPPPARAQQPGTVPGWEAPPSPPPVREQHPDTAPGWEAPPSPPPGWEQQPGKMPTNPEPSKTTDRFTWQETPVIEQEKKTPPELKWEQSKESQWRGQDTLSRWEEGNHPRRPEPPPMEPKAPHIALKLLLIVGVLLSAGAVATGLYFGLIA